MRRQVEMLLPFAQDRRAYWTPARLDAVFNPEKNNKPAQPEE